MERERVRAEKQMEGPVGQKNRRISELESQSQRKDLRIAELESDVRKVSSDYDGATKGNLAIAERLKQSEELSAARSAGISYMHRCGYATLVATNASRGESKDLEIVVV